ncbi:MAG: hypothetical protein IT448_02255 [Phycisphaerales bacterium]|nr:hypothetical protein [Phycisphaerales bacterium]
MNWDFATIADDLARALQTAEQDLQLQQAVYGLDALDERQMHALLAEQLASQYDIAREVHYPSSFGNKLTHRLRCDLVLSPLGQPLRLDSRLPTLFDPPNTCPAEKGLWLEVKCAHQFREGGVVHTGYGAQWRNGVVEDLRKMEAEPRILQAGMVLIIFTESPEILTHDLELFQTVLIKEEVLAGTHQVRQFPIWQRNEHRLCTIALWPTIQRS